MDFRTRPQLVPNVRTIHACGGYLHFTRQDWALPAKIPSTLFYTPSQYTHMGTMVSEGRRWPLAPVKSGVFYGNEGGPIQWGKFGLSLMGTSATAFTGAKSSAKLWAPRRWRSAPLVKRPPFAFRPTSHVIVVWNSDQVHDDNDEDDDDESVFLA